MTLVLTIWLYAETELDDDLRAGWSTTHIGLALLLINAAIGPAVIMFDLESEFEVSKLIKLKICDLLGKPIDEFASMDKEAEQQQALDNLRYIGQVDEQVAKVKERRKSKFYDSRCFFFLSRLDPRA